MTTSSDDIRRWLDEGKTKGATHVVIVCDTFDYEDFPVYVMLGEDVHQVVAQHTSQNMERVMEVYSLTGKHLIEAQLVEPRANHLD